VLPILITVVVVVGVIGVIYLFGSQSSGDKRRSSTGARADPRRATPSRTKKKGRSSASAYAQPPAWLRRLPLILVIAAVVCLVISVSQFRVEQQQGTPVVALVLDTSMSMDAKDVSPNRLVAAQSAAQLFLQQLPGDFEVVLVTFADEPAVLVPATTDHDTVSQALGDVPRGEGTVIGDGLSEAIGEIQTAQAGVSGETPAAVVLLSDGRDTGSRVPPEEAAQAAATGGIPVYTVVLGADTGKGGANTELLQQIATTTGGTMSTAGTSQEVSSIYESLGSQLSSQLEVSSSAQLFLVIAIALGIAAALITIVLALRTRQY
jgi:Ca-activated chloride channel family protein